MGLIKRTFGPVALTTTLTTNVYNQGSALIYDVLKMLLITNKTGSAATFSLWLGATGANTAGTELYSAVSVAANSTLALPYTGLRMGSADFLVGGAGTTLALVISGMGEQFVV